MRNLIAQWRLLQIIIEKKDTALFTVILKGLEKYYHMRVSSFSKLKILRVKDLRIISYK